MASKNHSSSQSQKGSKGKSNVSISASGTKTSSGRKSKESAHQKVDTNKPLSSKSESPSLSLGAVTSSTQGNNRDCNILSLQVSLDNEDDHYQDYNSTTYATNVLGGAASLGVEIPLHLQEDFVDRHGKRWPNFDPTTRTLAAANESTNIVDQKIEYNLTSLGWSASSGIVRNDGYGEYLYGISAQFEQ